MSFTPQVRSDGNAVIACCDIAAVDADVLAGIDIDSVTVSLVVCGWSDFGSTVLAVGGMDSTKH